MRRPALLGNPVFCAVDGFEHTVCEVIDQSDEEVAAAHRRVADLEVEDAARGIEFVECVPVAGIERRLFGPFADLLVERRNALVREPADRFAQDQSHQIVVRVVAARDLASKARRLGHHAVDLGLLAVVVGRLHFVDQCVFQQPFVDAAEVRYRKVAVVDPGVQQVFGTARQGIDDRRHYGVGHPRALEQGRARTVEEAAVIGRHADGVVALVDQQEGALQIAPDVVEPRR